MPVLAYIAAGLFAWTLAGIPVALLLGRAISLGCDDNLAEVGDVAPKHTERAL